MANISFNASGTTNTGDKIAVQLGIYIFIENDIYVAYCPSLDISAAGNSFDEALKEFGEILQLHIEYCMTKKTLFEDLKQHGWTIKKKTAKAPEIEKMIVENDTFKDILSNKNYQKIIQPVHIPAYA
ncbi:MAG: type II toxin-antitoxin system HicB family antitoxin [Prevotellaceae bacterium]|jgi:predicted RNase H-like HicB family nuclease|nr:type II toxin-antitoxin system HicB family antitoxin [Prevotellaceae bacterium]